MTDKFHLCSLQKGTLLKSVIDCNLYSSRMLNSKRANPTLEDVVVHNAAHSLDFGAAAMASSRNSTVTELGRSMGMPNNRDHTI